MKGDKISPLMKLVYIGYGMGEYKFDSVATFQSKFVIDEGKFSHKMLAPVRVVRPVHTYLIHNTINAFI